MKKDVSTFGLIDLAALNKVLKTSDTLYWKRDAETGVSLVCNGHWIIRAYIPETSKAFTTLCGIFRGVPDTLKSYNKKWNDVKDAAPDMEKRLPEMLNIDKAANVYNTRLTMDIPDGSLRIYYAATTREKSYCVINTRYADMVTSDAGFTSSLSGKTPVLFENENEAALLLPVNNTDIGYGFLK